MLNKSSFQPDLSMIEPVCWPAALKALEERNGPRFALCGSTWKATLELVVANRELLRQLGIYEAALIAGYCGPKNNYHRWPTPTLKAIFDQADRQRLLATGGSPPTMDEPITIYQGVYDQQCRRFRGLSWTLAMDVAAWFTLGGSNPAVYVATVQGPEVYCYPLDLDGRDEQEIIAWPRTPVLMQLSNADFDRLRQTYEKRSRCADLARKERLAKLLGSSPAEGQDGYSAG